MNVNAIQINVQVSGRPRGTRHSRKTAIANGSAPKIMYTRRLPKREVVRSETQPNSGSLTASQTLPTSSALPTSAGATSAASV